MRYVIRNARNAKNVGKIRKRSEKFVKVFVFQAVSAFRSPSVYEALHVTAPEGGNDYLIFLDHLTN